MAHRLAALFIGCGVLGSVIGVGALAHHAEGNEFIAESVEQMASQPRSVSESITFKNDGSGEMVMGGGQRVRMEGFSGTFNGAMAIVELSKKVHLQGIDLTADGGVSSVRFAAPPSWPLPVGEYRVRAISFNALGQLDTVEFAYPPNPGGRDNDVRECDMVLVYNNDGTVSVSCIRGSCALPRNCVPTTVPLPGGGLRLECACAVPT